MKKHVIRLFAAACLAAAPLLARDDKKPEMPKAPAELSQVKFFAGSWTCSGTGFATPGSGPEHKTAAAVKFILGCVDSMGGYCTQTSSGWSGDSMVFEGTSNMGGQKPGVRDTFTKKGSKQLTHLGEMQGQDGNWMKLDEETCTRSAK